MTARKRTPAATRKQNERERELRQEHEATQLRIERLQIERQQLDQQLKGNEAAQHQMIGRMRYIEEQLGLVPPMIEPEPLPASEEEEQEAA